jgi:hypothetical protein
MEYWEFLLQKEGDRSWLPLESPDVEILEGRYRVVARSSRVNAPVEIRVSHLVPEERPAKQRIQSRLSQTNRDGLVVVMPFTRMQPGVWELSCRGDLMADMLGEGWRYSVLLQVSQEAEADWESSWQSPEPAFAASSIEQSSVPVIAALPEVGEAVRVTSIDAAAAELEPQPSRFPAEIASKSVSPEHAEAPVPVVELVSSSPEPDALPEGMVPIAAVTAESMHHTRSEGTAAATSAAEAAEFESMFELPIELSSDCTPSDLAEHLSEQLVESLFQELDEPADLPALAPEPVAHLTAASSSSYQLSLSRDTYVVRRGETLSLSGAVQASQPEAAEVFRGEIRISLRDPQRSVVLTATRQALVEQPLPLAFEYTVTIPADYETHLLLGDVTLHGDATDTSALASCSFTATTDLNELLEAIADEYPSDLVQPPLEFSAEADAHLNLSFLELLNAPQPLVQFQPSPQKNLPPQLYQPDSDRAKPKLELPFANRSLAAVPSVAPEPAETATEPLSAELQEIERQAVESQPAEPQLVEFQPVPQPEPADRTPTEAAFSEGMCLEADSPLEWQASTRSAGWLSPIEPAAEPPSTPEDAAFRSLNLKQRFWSRLSALATDIELTTWLRTVPVADSLSSSTIASMPPLAGADADLVAQEIVVEDELDDRTALHQRRAPAEPEEPPAALILPEDEPVPTPQLGLPTGELIAGQPITAVVKLPNLMPRIFVKLWLRDRQTRLLLDGPRWLVNFLPTGLGEVEARAQLTVPLGCLELQLEAIAVEMATQRESHKVTIDRLVVPPDLPMLSLDELDV